MMEHVIYQTEGNFGEYKFLFNQCLAYKIIFCLFKFRIHAAHTPQVPSGTLVDIKHFQRFERYIQNM